MKYKVSLFICPGSFPFWFVVHPWFVLEDNRSISRWDVIHVRRNPNNWSHVYQNFLPPTQGLGIFHYALKPAWKPSLIQSIEGNEGSTAQKIVEFIENSKDTYPYRDKYSFIGPNSNTYVQWVLNNFPEFKVKLPWNAIGKNYAR